MAVGVPISKVRVKNFRGDKPEPSTRTMKGSKAKHGHTLSRRHWNMTGPSKRRKVTLTGEAKPKSNQSSFTNCPVCGKAVPILLINIHLDSVECRQSHRTADHNPGTSIDLSDLVMRRVQKSDDESKSKKTLLKQPKQEMPMKKQRSDDGIPSNKESNISKPEPDLLGVEESGNIGSSARWWVAGQTMEKLAYSSKKKVWIPIVT